MGERGPAKKPAALKRLEGTYRADRDAGFEPEVAIPAPPRHWKKRSPQMVEWLRVTPDLESQGLISQFDMAALVAYCERWADQLMFRAILDEEGEFLEKRDGQRYPHPARNQLNQALKDVVSYAKQFGFTPSSRSGVKGSEGPKRGNRFGALPGGGKVTPFTKEAEA